MSETLYVHVNQAEVSNKVTMSCSVSSHYTSIKSPLNGYIHSRALCYR